MGREIKALSSNNFALDTTPQRLGWLVPSNPSTSITTLHEQYEAQGYLWLKGILERREVLAFRQKFFEAFHDTGILALDSDPVDGIYSGQNENGEQVHSILMQVVRWAEYEAFCLSAPIVEFYRAFFQDEIYLHKRKLMRHTLPNDPRCTGAHYDLVYLRDGTDRLCSSWIPLGDTPVEMGGLVYLENSAEIGRELEVDFQAQSRDFPTNEKISAYNRKAQINGWLGQDLAALAERYNRRWLVADYEAGDMVVHSPYTIHASTVNTDAQSRIRLSTDIRFQALHDKIDQRWRNDWSFDDKL